MTVPCGGRTIVTLVFYMRKWRHRAAEVLHVLLAGKQWAALTLQETTVCDWLVLACVYIAFLLITQMLPGTLSDLQALGVVHLPAGPRPGCVLPSMAHRLGPSLLPSVPCPHLRVGSPLALDRQCSPGSEPGPCSTLAQCPWSSHETLCAAWGPGSHPAPALPLISIFSLWCSGQVSKEELLAIVPEACWVPE